MTYNMKMLIIILILITVLGSCSAVNENQGFSTLQVNSVSKSILRAESEGQLVDLFVFDEDGTLAAYSQMPGSDNIILRNGHSYSIWALADISELELAKTAHLSYLDTLSFSLSQVKDNSALPSAGHAAIKMMGDDLNINLTMERYVSRLTLTSIVDSLPGGSIKLICAYLSNVRACSDLNGNCTGWLNPMGRVTESPVQESHIIDGDTYLADCPGMTYTKIDRILKYGDSLKLNASLYCFPNAVDPGAEAYGQIMSDRQTRLVVVAEVDGKRCYYPYSLPALKRNVAYSCKLTIHNPGTSDPELPLTRDMLIVEQSLENWSDNIEIPTFFK